MADVILTLSGIYAIRNTDNGKVYVGSAVNLRKRWHNHLHALRANKHHSPHLQYAWNKYGESKFKFEVLQYVDVPDNLIQAEQRWIDEFSAYGKGGYNATPKAGSALGRKASDELRAKLSALHTGRKQSQETKDKRAAKLIGRKFSAESRAKISSAYEARKAMHGYVPPNKGIRQTADHKANARAARGTIRHTEETKRKISAKKTGVPITFSDPLRRALKISMSQKGKVISAETRAKMSKARKGKSLIPPDIQQRVVMLFSNGMKRLHIALNVGIHRHTVGVIVKKHLSSQTGGN